MKITKKQFKALIREQVAAALDETEWRDVSDQANYFEPHSQNIDNTEASMTPNKEVEAELALSNAIDALSSLGYSEEDLVDLMRDLIPRASGDRPSWEDDASHPDSPDYEENLEEESNRTAKGNVTQDARDDHATLSDGRFPIFDKKSALAALKLRGHGTTAAERKKIIDKAAKYAPEAAEKAREVEKDEKKK